MRRDLKSGLAAAAFLLSGCGQSESVTLELSVPSIAALDPSTDSRLAWLSLSAEGAEIAGLPASIPFGPGAQGATFPRLPVGFHGDLAMEMLSEEGRGILLGMGRAPGVRIDPNGGNVVAQDRIRFGMRKPLTYVGGNRDVQFLDASGPTPTPLGAIGGAPSQVTAMAAWNDGRGVLVASNNPVDLWELDTGNHTWTKVAIDLPARVDRIVIDVADRAAILVHEMGVATWTRPMARKVQTTGAGFRLAEPARSAALYSVDGASILLITGMSRGSCAGPSSLERRQPAGTPIASPIELPFTVSDVALSAAGALLVGTPCNGGQVLELDPDTGEQKSLLIDKVPGLSEISATRGAVMALGIAPGSDGVPVITMKKLAPGATAPVGTPVVVPSADLLVPMQLDPTTKTLFASEAEVVDAAFGPDLDHVVVAMHVTYKSRGQMCGAPLKLTVSALWTGTFSNPNGAAYRWTESQIESSCAIGGGVPSSEAFEPAGLATLFGGS